MMRSVRFQPIQAKGNKAMASRRRQMRPLEFPSGPLPPYVDLRRWMTPIETQGQMETWSIFSIIVIIKKHFDIFLF